MSEVGYAGWGDGWRTWRAQSGRRDGYFVVMLCAGRIRFVWKERYFFGVFTGAGNGTVVGFAFAGPGLAVSYATVGMCCAPPF